VIACGVSIGIQPSIDHLLATVEKELAAGYQRIKLKCKLGWDVDVFAAVRNRWPSILLSCDANSAYRLKDADHVVAFDDFHLLMVEQPLWSDDFYFHSMLQKRMETAICLDESIRNRRDALAAIDMESCRIINIKCGRVGGFSEAIAVHNAAMERGIPVWCGGMLESGIGRAHNIALSSLENFSLPGDVSASKRYWTEDIIEPEVEVSSTGEIPVPDTPGRGFEVRFDLIERLTVRKERVRAMNSFPESPGALQPLPDELRISRRESGQHLLAIFHLVTTGAKTLLSVIQSSGSGDARLQRGLIMTPQESDLLNGLIRNIQQTQLSEKDPEAEQLLQQGLGNDADALYILAQTVLVQNLALDQARAQVQQLQQQVTDLQQHANQPSRATSFLGSLLGHNNPAPPPPPAQSQSAYTPVNSPPPAYAAPQYQAAPVQQYQTVPVQGGAPSFLRSAATTAAGVAAGALAFEGIESLLHGGHPGGFGGGFGQGGFGMGGYGGAPVEETIVNNYYDRPGEGQEHHQREAAYDDRADGGRSDNASFDPKTDTDDYDDRSGSGGGRVENASFDPKTDTDDYGAGQDDGSGGDDVAYDDSGDSFGGGGDEGGYV
jgi:hypothetical protein